MSFEWHKLLEFAHAANSKVADFPDQEAVYRTATSRAYYAAFCEARYFVAKKDKETFHSNVHQELQDYLIQHKHQPRNQLGRNLRRLHQYRVLADYESELKEQPVNLASKALTLAKKIIEEDFPALNWKKV